MVVGTLALVGAIVTMTLLLTKRAMRSGREVKVWMIIPVNGIVVALTVALLGGGWYVFRRYQYDQCKARAERSQGNHDQNLLLYSTIDVVTGTPVYTYDPQVPGYPALREALNVNLPMLDPGLCNPP